MSIQIGPDCWRCGKQMAWRMCGRCMGEGCEYCAPIGCTDKGGYYYCPHCAVEG